MATYTYAYPHPAIATDVAIFTLRGGALAVLLVERGQDPFQGKWALPGGFLQPDEDLDACARRELLEETQVDAPVLVHFANFSAPDRDRRGPNERVVSVAYFALLPSDRLELRAQTDASDARWFGLGELPELAFDHAQIVARALSALKDQITRSLDTLFALLPARFSLSALQRAYEAVTQAPTEKRNFRKMALSSDLIEETNEMERGSHRPARLYAARSALTG